MVNQAFQTLVASGASAVAALRQTATTRSGPTQAGLGTFNGAVAAAITQLGATIRSDLSNLRNTGGGLIATIDGYTAALQNQLQSAGSGLANSTNQAVLALRREGLQDVALTRSRTNGAILGVHPAGALSGPTLQAYDQSVRAADQSFNLTISNDKQAAIANGTPLDSPTVSSAVAKLQTALTSAIGNLGSGFTSSTFNPTSTVTSQLATIQNQLLAIAAPIRKNSVSQSLFSRTVSSVVARGQGAINLTVTNAIRGYNTSLL